MNGIHPGTPSAEALAIVYRACGELLAADRRLRIRDRVLVDGLSVYQVITLLGLQAEGETTVGNLTQLADVNPATMTAMLDELDSAGIIVRTRSSADRRVVMVSLTAKGEELATRRRDDWEARWQAAFDGVDEDALQTTANGMRRIAAILNDIGNAAPAEPAPADDA